MEEKLKILESKIAELCTNFTNENPDIIIDFVNLTIVIDDKEVFEGYDCEIEYYDANEIDAVDNDDL